MDGWPGRPDQTGLLEPGKYNLKGMSYLNNFETMQIEMS